MVDHTKEFVVHEDEVPPIPLDQLSKDEVITNLITDIANLTLELEKWKKMYNKLFEICEELKKGQPESIVAKKIDTLSIDLRKNIGFILSNQILLRDALIKKGIM